MRTIAWFVSVAALIGFGIDAARADVEDEEVNPYIQRQLAGRKLTEPPS
jgi:hypothetical protein